MVVYLNDGTQEHVFKPDEPGEFIKIVRERLGSDIADNLNGMIESLSEAQEDVSRLELGNKELESEVDDLNAEIDKLTHQINSLKSGQVESNANL